ncbi:MAG: cupin domain-containing protein [Candidatus Aenigmarchaeota archaeon]|nr:cupin domain-containing protein [Candidatus Aenigmarchaeota archaeon]
MKILEFEEKHSYGGNRVTIFRRNISFKKIESFQILKLTLDLDEPFHVNKHGNVFCFVIDGWMEAYVDGKTYKLKRNQGILFEQGEKHKIIKCEGLMLSMSSEEYGKKLATEWGE